LLKELNRKKYSEKTCFVRVLDTTLMSRDCHVPLILFLKKYKAVIFVNGCFWHGHRGCKKAALPETNTDFWKEKIEATRLCDKKRVKKLKNL
jgi:DNA mismatch endonuclease Vsr